MEHFQSTFILIKMVLNVHLTQSERMVCFNSNFKMKRLTDQKLDIKIMYNPRPKEGFGERQQNQQPYQNNNNNEWSAGEDDGDVVM